MARQQTLRDYMLEGGALNKAFVSDAGEVYIVKDFRYYQKPHPTNLPLIDADIIMEGARRERAGLALGGVDHAHLHDRKATRQDIIDAINKTPIKQTLY